MQAKLKPKTNVGKTNLELIHNNNHCMYFKSVKGERLLLQKEPINKEIVGFTDSNIYLLLSIHKLEPILLL